MAGCVEIKKLLHVFVDGEFGEGEAAEVERHLSGCASCRAEVERIYALKERLRTALPRTKTPEALKAKIAKNAAEALAPKRSLFFRVAIPALAAASVALGAVAIRYSEEGEPPVVSAAISRHEDELPIEIPGPSPEKVSHWFQGKVPFPVRVPRFSDGTHLLGGRLSAVDQVMAAHLTYERNGKKITVLAFDASKLKAPLAPEKVKIRDRDVYLSTAHGYQIAVFQDHGVGYSITADFASDADITDIVAAGWSH
jgi:anti-sigma factor RsiW